MRDVRPRVECPGCRRSIAVTFDRDGNVWVRTHVRSPGVPCPRSRSNVRHLPLTFPVAARA